MAGVFKRENIRCRYLAANWRMAVRAGGEILVESGSVTEQYVDGMVRVIEDYGPYMVVAPGLAVVHGPPGENVIRPDLAFMTLEKPVCFGCGNDPVSLLLVFAATDAQTHLAALSRAARVLDPLRTRELLAAARTDAELEYLLNDQWHPEEK